MHLNDSEIARLIDDRIKPEERDQYLKHISTCENCFEVYTETIKSLEKEEVKKPAIRFIVVAVKKRNTLDF